MRKLKCKYCNRIYDPITQGSNDDVTICAICVFIFRFKRQPINQDELKRVL